MTAPIFSFFGFYDTGRRKTAQRSRSLECLAEKFHDPSTFRTFSNAIARNKPSAWCIAANNSLSLLGATTVRGCKIFTCKITSTRSPARGIYFLSPQSMHRCRGVASTAQHVLHHHQHQQHHVRDQRQSTYYALLILKWQTPSVRSFALHFSPDDSLRRSVPSKPQVGDGMGFRGKPKTYNLSDQSKSRVTEISKTKHSIPLLNSPLCVAQSPASSLTLAGCRS